MIGLSPDVTNLKDGLLLLEERLSQEQGRFALFALFKREDAYGDWDLVISAPWVGDNKMKLLDLISLDLKKNFVWEDRAMLSRIVILAPDDPFVEAINKLVDVAHAEDIRITDRVVNEVPIEDSYIITSKGLSGAS